MSSFLDNPTWVICLGAYWQGLSVAFASTLALLWAKPYFDNHDWRGRIRHNDPSLERPFLERVAISLPLMVGVCGSILSLGAIRFALEARDGDYGSLYSVFLFGALIGLALALLVKRRL